MINIPKDFMQCPPHTADTTETMNLGKQLAAEGRLTRFEIAVQKNAKNVGTDAVE